MTFLDLFSAQSAQYAAARPPYPPALFDYIASISPAVERAWDCGAGNGQAAVWLAQRFQTVYATDPSRAQVENAMRHPAVHYSVQVAEAAAFPAACFDAVCVAQALHWFDLPVFFDEARRVMKPGAVFAAWGYSGYSITPEFDREFQRLVLDVIAGDWAPQIQILWHGYQDIELPFERLQPPEFEILVTWTLEQLLAYVQTWSAVRRCMDRIGPGFMQQAAIELATAWGTPGSAREIHKPLRLLAGINR